MYILSKFQKNPTNSGTVQTAQSLRRRQPEKDWFCLGGFRVFLKGTSESYICRKQTKHCVWFWLGNNCFIETQQTHRIVGNGMVVDWCSYKESFGVGQALGFLPSFFSFSFCCGLFIWLHMWPIWLWMRPI